jgi:hypothetical protein
MSAFTQEMLASMKMVEATRATKKIIKKEKTK